MPKLIEDLEVAKCPWCQEEVLVASLEAHWKKKKCVQKGEDDIFQELRQGKVLRLETVPKKHFKIKLERIKVPWYRKLLFWKKREKRDICWVWVDEIRITNTERREVNRKLRDYDMRDYQIRWMEDPE